MKILNYRPSPSSGAAIGFAEIEAAPGVRLFNVKIIRTDDGGLRAYARNAAFDRAAIAEISKSLGGECLDRVAS
ncbi:MAG: hypothetical protein J0H89_00115 [Rhizobiales bacterium]|nr:hypothetical protein [Hyphomicrobiales bacterium]